LAELGDHQSQDDKRNSPDGTATARREGAKKPLCTFALLRLVPLPFISGDESLTRWATHFDQWMRKQPKGRGVSWRPGV
jgi:hypothetical protein